MLADDPRVGSQILSVPFPKKVEELKTIPLLTQGDFDAELYWVSCIVRLFGDKLSKFVGLRNKFSHAILTARFEEADKLLSEIEQSFGQSIWLIECKIGLLADWKGLEGQKEYSRSIIKLDKVRQNIRYLACYFSVRAEQSVSPRNIARWFRNLCSIIIINPNEFQLLII